MTKLTYIEIDKFITVDNGAITYQRIKFRKMQALASRNKSRKMHVITSVYQVEDLIKK
jgi:hypothetical protein